MKDKNTKPVSLCASCGKENPISSRGPRVVCSIICRNRFNALKGKSLSARINKSLSKTGEKNPNWLGDKVGYDGIHSWIKRRISRPACCELCGRKTGLDLANISQEYKRDLTDWEWLCRGCHMTKDGRRERLVKRMVEQNPNPHCCAYLK